VEKAGFEPGVKDRGSYGWGERRFNRGKQKWWKEKWRVNRLA